MSNEKLVDDLVAQLDGSFSSGSGHVNVTVNKSGVTLETIDSNEQVELKINQKKSLDCDVDNLACRTPTLFEGMDQVEEEEHE